ATIQEALRLDDVESIDCLPNEEIFTELSRMSLVRNVDSSTKFYMYSRFLQLMIREQVGDLSSHSTKYSSSALTQKVFANMRRVGKGFYRVDTPLFEGMIAAQQDDDVADEGAASVVVDDVPAAVDEASIPSPIPTTQPPPPSQDLPSTSQVQHTPPPSLIAQPPSPQQQPQPSHDAEISMDLLQTLLETSLITPITAATITAAPSAARRRKEVVIRDPEETATPSIIIHAEPKSKDKGKGIMVEEPKPLKKQAQIEQDEAYARVRGRACCSLGLDLLP
nr:hypothetical protein [Tanacetum cinerariifolium]